LPPGLRPAIEALFGIDAAMGDVVRTTNEPLLGPIRLAWWRERLEEMDAGIPAPPEPRLQAAARALLPEGVSGRDVTGLESGWLRLFDPFPWGIATSEAIWFRGNLLFGLGARVIGKSDEQIQAAGGLWALIDVARRCSDPQSRAVLIGQAQTFARGLGGTRFPAALRPLSMLTAVAMRDAKRGEPFTPEGTPVRAAAMLRHRLTGQLPRG
jgi:phytoene synthase